MSAEYMVERVQDAVADMDGVEIVAWADENVRSGGYFFDLICKGKSYQIEVTEVREA